jgi:hypothetical protein
LTEAVTASPAVDQEVQRSFRWNFLVNTLDGATFGFGMSFFSSEIVLPLFVSHFTSSPLAIGLISFLGWGVFSCRSYSWPMPSSARPGKRSFR